VGGRTFVDTNLLLHLYDVREPAKSRVARRAYAAMEPGECVVSTQVLQEFYWNATRKLVPPLPPEVAARALLDLSAHETIQVDVPLIVAAATRGTSDRVAFWDALVVESALAGRCTRLLSEDLQDGRRFGTLVVENPFRGVR
jgi:predicted nucleic acid-binding protein